MKRQLSDLIRPSGSPAQKLQVLLVALAVVIAGTYTATQIFAASGSLSLLPASSTANLGSTFALAVRANSGTDAVNAVQAVLSYDPTKMEYVGVDETGSAFPLVAATSGAGGTVTLTRAISGGSPAPTGDNLVTTVKFKTLAAGATAVTIQAGSALLNAATNADILAVRNNASVTIADTDAPSIPSGLTTTTRNLTSITMSWSASTDNVGVGGYRVYRAGKEIGTALGTTFTDTGLVPGTNYTYTVAAVDAAGNVSAQSAGLITNTLADTGAPSVPGVPISPSQTTTSITLSWSASTDNVAVAGYRVFRGGAQIAITNTPSYTESGLNVNTGYRYTVAAFDDAGNVSAQSGVLSVSTLPDTTAPSVPTGLSATSNGRTVTVKWNASTDNVAVSGYLLYRDGAQQSTALLTGTTYTDSNVAPGVHTYAVAARDAAGNLSPQTTAVSVEVRQAADINGDGKVDVFDLSALLSGWGKTGAGLAADITGDGKVDIFDLSSLLSRWTR